MKGKRKTGSKNVTLGLLIMYLVVMTWIILFKMELDIRLLRQMNLRSINLIPFAGSLIVNGKADMSEVILNIAVFIPFGTYLSMLDRKMSFIMKVLPVFVVSLMYEVLQYCFAIGASDITDLLGNTLGGIIGIGLFAVCSKILGEKTVRVSVFNTGIPIPEESLPHIWEKFYKVDKARTREYGGSGVGLSIVKAIMESMHQAYGVINFTNGVEFWFHVDCSKVDCSK